jgi:hypothetical protein
MPVTYAADAVQPLQGIPASYRADRNKGVLLYGDGAFAAAPDIASVYPRRLFISTTGAIANVDRCRVLDVERFDATADHWPDWRAARVTWCKQHDNDLWPIVYCSIDPDPSHGVKAVLDACRLAGQEPPKHWWIANYTPGAFVPTVDDVVKTIKRLCGEEIDPDAIWGTQFADFGTFDKSVIFQPPRWQ